MKSQFAVWSFVIGLASFGYSIMYLLSYLEIFSILPFDRYIESRLILVLLSPIIFLPWFSQVGIVLGIIGLIKIHGHKELEGKWLAILGIVLCASLPLLMLLTFGG